MINEQSLGVECIGLVKVATCRSHPYQHLMPSPCSREIVSTVVGLRRNRGQGIHYRDISLGRARSWHLAGPSVTAMRDMPQARGASTSLLTYALRTGRTQTCSHLPKLILDHHHREGASQGAARSAPKPSTELELDWWDAQDCPWSYDGR